MPLTKEQIIEIQTAAKFNTQRLMREAEEQKKLKKAVSEEIAKAKQPEAIKAEVEAKVTTTAKKGK